MSRVGAMGLDRVSAPKVAEQFAKALGAEDFASVKLNGIYYVILSGCPGQCAAGRGVAFRTQDAAEYLDEVEFWVHGDAERTNDFPPVEPPMVCSKHVHWRALDEIASEDLCVTLEGDVEEGVGAS